MRDALCRVSLNDTKASTQLQKRKREQHCWSGKEATQNDKRTGWWDEEEMTKALSSSPRHIFALFFFFGSSQHQSSKTHDGAFHSQFFTNIVELKSNALRGRRDWWHKSLWNDKSKSHRKGRKAAWKSVKIIHTAETVALCCLLHCMALACFCVSSLTLTLLQTGILFLQILRIASCTNWERKAQHQHQFWTQMASINKIWNSNPCLILSRLHACMRSKKIWTRPQPCL